MKIEKRLADLNIVLPETPLVGSEQAVVFRYNEIMFVMEQVPARGRFSCYSGGAVEGRDAPHAREEARVCIVNLLTTVKSHLGTLDKVKEVLRLRAYVSGGDGQARNHRMINEVFQMLQGVFGTSDVHSSMAIYTNHLPVGVMVEFEAFFKICEG